MTLLNPASTMENLIYIGYPGDVSSTIRVTRKRRLDRKKQQSERNVFQCFVFGPKKAGKSALLDSFLGRSILWIIIQIDSPLNLIFIYLYYITNIFFMITGNAGHFLIIIIQTLRSVMQLMLLINLG